MNSTPFFSICIPSYNRPKELLRLLESIDYKGDDFEILICEDKSPKRIEVRKIVKKFIHKSNYIVKYIENNDNLGYDKNLKELIKNASGKYIIFMGDDDEFIKGALDKFILFIKNNPTLGYILRTYYVIHQDGDIEPFKYFSTSTFFNKGKEAYIKLFRRSVFMSGFTFRREYALPYLINTLDGALFFQLYIMAEITLHYPSAFCEIPITQMYKDSSISFFGSSKTEKELYTPGKATIDTSINVMKGYFKITGFIDNKYGLDSTNIIKKQLSKYSYPFLSIQCNRSLPEFLGYVKRLIQLGLGNTIHFYIYLISLIVFGRRFCDKFILFVKKILGRTPYL